MSMLVGVRGSDRESEGQALREGINHHQPSPFFNGNNNPSSSIWNNPPTPPLWRDPSPATSSFASLFPSSCASTSSSSSSTSSFFSFSSPSLSSSSPLFAAASSFTSFSSAVAGSTAEQERRGHRQEKQWHQMPAGSGTNGENDQEGVEGAQEAGDEEADKIEASRMGRPAEIGSIRGYSSGSDLSWSLPVNSVQQSVKDRLDGDSSCTSRSSFKKDEDDATGHHMGDSVATGHCKDITDDKFPFHIHDFNFRIPPSTGNIPKSQGGEFDFGNRRQSLFSRTASSDSPVTCSIPLFPVLASSTSTIDVTQATSKNAPVLNTISGQTAVTGLPFTSERCSRTSENASRNLNSHGFISGEPKESPEVFVFGASGGLETGVRAGFAQQNHPNFSASGPPTRSRIFKGRKNLCSTKGKGLAAGSCTGTGETSSESLESSFRTSSYPASSCSASGSVRFDKFDYSVSSADYSEAADFSRRNSCDGKQGNQKHAFTMYPNQWSSSGPGASLNAELKEIEELDSIEAVDVEFSHWHPFPHSDKAYGDANSKAGAQVQDTPSFRSEFAGDLFTNHVVDSMQSEEHISDVIAGVANIGERQVVDERCTPGGCEDANQRVKSTGILKGNDPAISNTYEAEKQAQESSISKQAKQDDGRSATFYPMFPKPDEFQGSLDGPKKTQETLLNHSFIKESKESFVFQASKLKRNSASNVGSVESSTSIADSNPSDNVSVSSGFMGPFGMFEKINRNDFLTPRGSGFDHVQGSSDCRSTTPSCPLFKSEEKLGVVNNANFIPNPVFVSQPSISSAGFRDVPHSYASNYFEAPREPHVSVAHDGGPIAEFSGQPSSSNSSASESSPRRCGEHWREVEEFPSSIHSFEFQASKKGANKCSNTRRKKERAQRLSSKHRRQGRPILSNGKKAESSYEGSQGSRKSPDGGGSPMDFSPRFETEPCAASPAASPLGCNYNIPNVEQPFIFQRSTVPSKSETVNKVDVERMVEEDSRAEELRAAAADLSIGNEQETGVNNPLYEGSHGQDFWWASTDASILGNGVWKMATFEEEQNRSAGFESLVNSHKEQSSENEGDSFDDLSRDGIGNNRRKHFRFMASPPRNVPSPSLPRRHGRRIQREKVDALKVITSRYGSDASSSRNDQETFDMEGLGNMSGSMAASILTAGMNFGEKNVTKALSQVCASHTSAHTVELDKTVSGFSCDASTTDPSIQSVVHVHRSETEMPASPRTVKSVAAEQVCERWRLRGNQAYAKGDFPKAEECYSRGASSVSPNETSQSCIRASMLCYSNRAATRMAVGRMRDALADCMRAMEVDPKFLRVRLRAASCHLALGESKAAASLFKECLSYAKESDKSDTRISTEVTEGLKKVQQLDDYSDRALELLGHGSTSDATAVLRLLNEALIISPYSEHLLELKAQALLSLRRYEEVIQLCEQSLASAERNHAADGNEPFVHVFHNSNNEMCTGSGNTFVNLWRWRMTAKALFQLGRLEESLDSLTKYEEGSSTITSEKSVSGEGGSVESLASFTANIRDLLRHKAAGNEAFQAGKHAEAVEHYTAALAYNGESRPFNAVCFCNRAAASQALGHIADAIADCSRAIALDPNYPKAISRRATLHEMVRDYGQACHDFMRFITLLENSQHGKSGSRTGRPGSANNNILDLSQARDRLAKAEEEMKKGHPLDHYMIMGVEPSCSANEIKKAYRKAALKHHPDKASQFLVRGENGDEGSAWKEVGDDVRSDAERLFKMIGESYAILSDPAKRLRYDTDEELRKLRTRSNLSATPGGTELYRSQYEKGSRRHRERWDSWTGYAQQHQRWQSGPDAAQPDTYARRGSYTSNNFKSGGDGGGRADYNWEGI